MTKSTTSMDALKTYNSGKALKHGGKTQLIYILNYLKKISCLEN
jgi:hypothetical protein